MLEDNQVVHIAINLNYFIHFILIVNAYPNTLVKILCKLKRFPSLYPPLTTLFILGWYGNRWYGNVTATTNGECSLADIERLTQGALAFNSLPAINELISSNQPTISGRTPTQLYEGIRSYVSERKSEEFFQREFRIEEIFIYDGLWALALALNKTIEQGFDITRVNYTADSEYLKAFYDNVIGLDFQGWSGRMSFVGNERYDGRVQVLEFVNASLQFRGHLRNIPRNPSDFANTSGIWYDKESDYTSWRADLASDGISMHPIHVSIFPLVLVLSVAACLYVTGIVAVLLVCWCRRMRPVTTSEPAITVTILSGTYFLFLLAVLLPVDGRYLGAGSGYVGGVIFCQTRYWLLAVSISVIFGAMLGKAAKFYIIVIKQRFDYSARLRPVYLLLFPLVLLLLDTAYFLVWLFVSPQVLTTHEIASGRENPPRYIVTECLAQDDTADQVFLWLLIASKSLLVLVGLFLAYNLRKVTHKSLRYSGTITWTMYNTCIFSLGIVLVLLLVSRLEIRYSLSALLSLAEGVIAATIVSGPILYYLVKDPKGEDFFRSSAKTSFPESQDLMKMRIEVLTKENIAMKRTIDKYTKVDNTVEMESLEFSTVMQDTT